MTTILFMLGGPPGGAEGGGSNMFQTFGFMALIFVVFWFFMIRPQRRKQKQREAMLQALGKGARVVSIGGIRGTVAKVNDNNTVSVKVDDGCKIEFSRSAIAEIISDEKASPAAPEEKPVHDEKKEKEEKGAL